MLFLLLYYIRRLLIFFVCRNNRWEQLRKHLYSDKHDLSHHCHVFFCEAMCLLS